MNQPLAKQIEALLFVSNEPLSVRQICNLLKKNSKEIQKALNDLKDQYKDRGLDIIEIDKNYEMVVRPKYSELLQKYQKDYVVRELSPAALEVLSIILFQGPISKLEIEDLRGINSAQTLRRLKVLGLVDEIHNSQLIINNDTDQNSKEEGEVINPTYKVSRKLLKHFGFESMEECKIWFEKGKGK